MNLPQDLKYHKEHDWLRLEADDLATVGITDFAAESLGDIVFVDLPEPGTNLVQFEKLGEIESVKAVSDLYSPISGRVVEINQEAIDNPEIVNDSPYGSGWLVKIAPSDPAEVDSLLSPSEYQALLAREEG
jgi:glycine cleavage system H protein